MALHTETKIYKHDPRHQVDVRSPAWLLAKVPAHKSLFNARIKPRRRRRLELLVRWLVEKRENL